VPRVLETVAVPRDLAGDAWIGRERTPRLRAADRFELRAVRMSAAGLLTPFGALHNVRAVRRRRGSECSTSGQGAIGAAICNQRKGMISPECPRPQDSMRRACLPLVLGASAARGVTEFTLWTHPPGERKPCTVKLIACIALVTGLTFGAFAPMLSAQNRCVNATTRCNCVLYARCRVPRLPGGLFTLNDKKRIMNSGVPTPGSVAVMDVLAGVGHLAVVEAVNRDGTITVSETNYRSCQYTVRTGTPRNMRVLGYFRP
jgi:hypothetical protein